jgi:hypothetical protein
MAPGLHSERLGSILDQRSAPMAELFGGVLQIRRFFPHIFRLIICYHGSVQRYKVRCLESVVK